MNKKYRRKTYVLCCDTHPRKNVQVKTIITVPDHSDYDFFTLKLYFL